MNFAFKMIKFVFKMMNLMQTSREPRDQLWAERGRASPHRDGPAAARHGQVAADERRGHLQHDWVSVWPERFGVLQRYRWSRQRRQCVARGGQVLYCVGRQRVCDLSALANRTGQQAWYWHCEGHAGLPRPDSSDDRGAARQRGPGDLAHSARFRGVRV